VIDALRNRALNILGQTQHMFSPGINVDKYLSIVAEMIAVGTAASGVVIFLKDESAKLFKVKTSYGDFKTEHEKLCLSFCDISNIIIIGEGTEAPVKLQQKIAGTGLTSLMSLPMTVKGENIGFIQCLRSAGNKPFAEADKNFAAVISWWSAVALDNINLFHKVEEQRMHVDELLHEVSHAQENERKRVAIEIHDGVAQWMVGATFGIKACSQLISESRLTELQTELAKIGQTLQKSVRELRRTIANLRPLALEENGFDKAIGQVVKPLLEDGIGCELQIDKELPALTFPQETTIYWIIQEALSNVRSHSAASHAIINIASGDGHLNVTVKDNGSGFNPEETIKSAIPLEHMGLLGMYERVRLLSGNMHIESHPGTGTTISVSLPLTVNETVDATT